MYSKRNTRLRSSQQQHVTTPGTFLCPLSGAIMEEPVMDTCAHNFDRKSICDWIENHHAYCPISRKPLTVADLIPNHALAERIEQWQWRHTYPVATINESQELYSSVTYDVDGASDDDLEKGGYMTKNAMKSPSTQGSLLYQPIICNRQVPVEFMLLPQERQILAYVHNQEQVKESMQRKKRCLHAITTIGVVVVLFLSCWLLYMYMQR